MPAIALVKAPRRACRETSASPNLFAHSTVTCVGICCRRPHSAQGRPASAGASGSGSAVQQQHRKALTALQQPSIPVRGVPTAPLPMAFRLQGHSFGSRPSSALGERVVLAFALVPGGVRMTLALFPCGFQCWSLVAPRSSTGLVHPSHACGYAVHVTLQHTPFFPLIQLTGCGEL